MDRLEPDFDFSFRIEKIIWEKGGSMSNWLAGKKAIIIGERDGVQGPAIAKCLEAAGAKVAYAVTECFV